MLARRRNLLFERSDSVFIHKQGVEVHGPAIVLAAYMCSTGQGRAWYGSRVTSIVVDERASARNEREIRFWYNGALFTLGCPRRPRRGKGHACSFYSEETQQ